MGVDKGGCVGALGTRDLSVGQVSLAGYTLSLLAREVLTC